MALQCVAGKAIGHERCTQVKKIVKGGFNKVFLVTADDGREAIARIPTHIAGPPRYITASEVATIDSLRTVLGLPMPKILDYATSSENPVGAEYIIMERVHGESFGSRWLSLTTDEVWNESEALLSTIRDHLRVDVEGGTKPENFDWAFHRNLEFRLEMVRQAEEHERDICWRTWPYKGGDGPN